jgi:hypothetical protein
VLCRAQNAGRRSHQTHRRRSPTNHPATCQSPYPPKSGRSVPRQYRPTVIEWLALFGNRIADDCKRQSLRWDAPGLLICFCRPEHVSSTATSTDSCVSATQPLEPRRPSPASLPPYRDALLPEPVGAWLREGALPVALVRSTGGRGLCLLADVRHIFRARSRAAAAAASNNSTAEWLRSDQSPLTPIRPSISWDQGDQGPGRRRYGDGNAALPDGPRRHY